MRCSQDGWGIVVLDAKIPKSEETASVQPGPSKPALYRCLQASLCGLIATSDSLPVAILGKHDF